MNTLRNVAFKEQIKDKRFLVELKEINLNKKIEKVKYLGTSCG
jgi:hypothetical protein